MDEKSLTFAEAKGTEANQQAKKLAQEKSKKKKSKYDSYFTVKGQKVIKFTVKPNGVYNEYVGKLGTKKPESSQLKDMITIWKKDKVFVEPHELESFCESKIKQLNR